MSSLSSSEGENPNKTGVHMSVSNVEMKREQNSTVPKTPLYKLPASFLNQYGTWAVVTGASDGIGREFAQVLAENGFNLVLCARREERLQSLAAVLQRDYGIDCGIVAADLSQPEGMARLRRVADDYDVGLLVAAAGFGTSGRFLDGEPADELEMLSVNCAAVLEQCLHYSNKFAARGKGGIVLMSSLLAFMGTPRSANYAATKAYIQSLAEGMYEELKPLGVDVIASAPGPIATGFASRANLQMAQSLRPRVVATQTLAALGKRCTVRPGWLSKLLGWSLATAPRSLRVKIIALVMKGMTAHQLETNLGSHKAIP